MKRKISRLAVLALLAVTMLTFAACGKKKDTNERVINKDAIYRETDLGIKFPEGFEINSLNISDSKIFASGYTYTDTSYTQSVILCNLDGSDMKTISFPGSDSYVDRLVPLSNGNTLIMINTYEEIVTEDSYDYNNYYYATIYDANGTQVKKVDLSEKTTYLSSIQVLEDKIYFFYDTTVAVYDMDLNPVNEKAYDTISFDRVYRLKDNSLLVSYWGEEGQQYKKLNLKTLELGDDIKLNILLYSYEVYEGKGYDLILKDNVSVYGFNLSDSEPKVLLNFVDSDIETSYFSSFASLDDKTFIGSYYDYSTDEVAFKVSKYEKVNPEDVVEKQVLTLGCLYLDDNVRKQVIKFNKTNEKYRIRVVDYSSYNTEDDWEAGTTKFNSDVASGKGPDIVIASDTTTVHNYITKGLYLDLTPYLEADAEINKEDFFPNVIEMGSSDGKLYEIIPSFYVDTVVGKKSILGDKTGWTMSEMMEFEKTIPAESKLMMGVTREEFINNMLSVNSSLYIDMASGKCSFDTADFRGLLEYAKALPKGDEDYYNKLEDEGYWESYEELWRSNKAVLMPTSIYNLSEYNQLLKGYFGEDITFIGYPSEDRNGSSAYYYFSLGISSKCASPESAWSFVRTYLLPDYQKTVYGGIPASIAAFDELGKKAQEREYYMVGDEKIYEDQTFYVNGQEVPITPLTAAEVQKYKDFIMSINKVQGSLSSVEKIIDEETQGYFLGDKSLDDVVKNIQGRVQIYISEKR